MNLVGPGPSLSTLCRRSWPGELQKKTWKLVSKFGEHDDLATCMTNKKVTDLPKIKIVDSNFAVLKWYFKTWATGPIHWFVFGQEELDFDSCWTVFFPSCKCVEFTAYRAYRFNDSKSRHGNVMQYRQKIISPIIWAAHGSMGISLLNQQQVLMMPQQFKVTPTSTHSICGIFKGWTLTFTCVTIQFGTCEFR